ncbi:hypothetical protein DPMN_053598 [Dreissena polymorpha]|uniref:Uncharacterized protein n=1 Tax=Dreissena polymorpha TaxID=45954 RepID=A0A9D4CNN7_DREPO|nr:hypothetical protein DPMN_053598 [Dreissena polymorpha]
MTSPSSVPLAMMSPVLEKQHGFTGCRISCCLFSLGSGIIGSGSDDTVTSSAPVVVSQIRIVLSSALETSKSPASDKQ